MEGSQLQEVGDDLEPNRRGKVGVQYRSQVCGFLPVLTTVVLGMCRSRDRDWIVAVACEAFPG